MNDEKGMKIEKEAWEKTKGRLKGDRSVGVSERRNKVPWLRGGRNGYRIEKTKGSQRR